MSDWEFLDEDELKKWMDELDVAGEHFQHVTLEEMEFENETNNEFSEVYI